MRDLCVCVRAPVCVILFESLFVVLTLYILPSSFSLSGRSQFNDRYFRLFSIRPSVLSFQFAPLVLNRCMGCLYVVLLWISSSGFLCGKVGCITSFLPHPLSHPFFFTFRPPSKVLSQLCRIALL